MSLWTDSEVCLKLKNVNRYQDSLKQLWCYCVYNSLCAFYVPGPRALIKAPKLGSSVKRDTALNCTYTSYQCGSSSVELIKLPAQVSIEMESQDSLNVWKIKLNLSSLGVDQQPQPLSHVVRQCLDPVTYHKWSLTQSLPALHAAPSEKHLWTLFDKLIAKWAISWRGFWIASRKPEWLQEETACRC